MLRTWLATDFGAWVWSEMLGGRPKRGEINAEDQRRYRELVRENFTAISPAEAFKWHAVN